MSNAMRSMFAAFAQSVIATMVTQMSCYLRLVTHPDVLIVDLLDALSRNAVIGDDAATRLHRVLEASPGRFNVVVEGDRGIITTFKNISQKSLDRLSRNYGWTEMGL